MKFFPIFIFSMFILGCTENKVFQANLKRQHNKSILSLNGNVKSLTDNIYEFTNNDTINSLFKSKTVYLFDSLGNLTDEIGYRDSIIPYATSNYKFDKFNNITEIINNLEHSKSITKYTIGSGGKIFSKTKCELVGLNRVTYTNSVFNKNFNIVLETTQEENGEEKTKKYKYILDKNKNPIEINISEVLLFNNKPISKNMRTFDTQGRILESTVFLFEDNITTKNINVYDSSNLLSYTNIDYKGRVAKSIFKYDTFSNMTEDKRFGEDGNVSNYSETYKYIYDKYNNWIQRIDFDVNSKPTIVHRRTIQYY